MTNITVDSKGQAWALISDIKENVDALRAVNKEREEFVELMANIEANGVIQPIAIREDEGTEGKFVLIDGAHRFTCAKELGHDKIPVRVLSTDQLDSYVKQMSTNLHQIKTRPAEFARQLNRMLLCQPLMTMSELAASIGKSTTWLQGALKMTTLPREIQDLVDAGTINVVNAQSLASLPAEEMAAWAERAATQISAEFKPAVDLRIKEIAKAKREGKDPNAVVEFVPVARIRKLADINAVAADTAKISGIIGTTNDPVEAARLALKWAVSLDSKTVEEKKAAEAQRKAEAKLKSDEASEENLKKKADEVNKKLAEIAARKAAAAASAS